MRPGPLTPAGVHWTLCIWWESPGVGSGRPHLMGLLQVPDGAGVTSTSVGAVTCSSSRASGLPCPGSGGVVPMASPAEGRGAGGASGPQPLGCPLSHPLDNIPSRGALPFPPPCPPVHLAPRTRGGASGGSSPLPLSLLKLNLAPNRVRESESPDGAQSTSGLPAPLRWEGGGGSWEWPLVQGRWLVGNGDETRVS